MIVESNRSPDDPAPTRRSTPLSGLRQRRCPDCDSALVNVQGLADCPDCRWTDAIGDA